MQYRNEARRELRDTVAELADKVNVRARAEGIADQIAAKTPDPVVDWSGQALGAARRHRTLTAAVISGAVVTVWVLRRRNSSST